MKAIVAFIFTASISTLNSQIIISEAQSSNDATLADNVGEYDDWIEIKNTSDEPFDIGGLVLKDQVDTWAIPTGDPSTILPPGGYFLLWADDQEEQGDFHTNFKLASGGEFLGLYEADGTTVMDSISLPALSADHSLIRCSETEWMSTASPSPLEDNNCSLNINTNEVFTFDLRINVTDLTVFYSTNATEEFELKLYSVNGTLILNQKVVSGTSINTTDLEQGIYFVELVNTVGSRSKKIVITR